MSKNDYVYTSPRGIKTTITQNHINEAYTVLVQAGYEMKEAHDMSLQYIIHRLNLEEIPESDLLFSNHNQQESCHFCGTVAARLAERRIDYQKRKYI